MRPNEISISVAASALLTTAEAKTHLRVDSSDEDTYIDTIVATATKFCENYTARQIMRATIIAKFGGFPSSSSEAVHLPFGQLVSIGSIAYKDSAGDSQTWTSSKYQANTYAQPGYILPVENESYPDTQDRTWDAVTITFDAGWTSTALVPADIKHAVKLMVSYYFENRGTVHLVGSSAVNLSAPMAVYTFLDAYSLREFV